MAYYRVERPDDPDPEPEFVEIWPPRPPLTGWARWRRAWRVDVDFRWAVAVVAVVLFTLCASWFRW